MKQKKITANRQALQPSNRILAEMLETASDLNRHGLMSKEDMLELSALCDVPPAYTAERVAQVRTINARMTQSVFANFLNKCERIRAKVGVSKLR